MNAADGTGQIWVNGEPRAALVDETVDAFLARLGLPPQTALVELNGQPLLRSEWPHHTLASNDRLEILRVVAGG